MSYILLTSRKDSRKRKFNILGSTDEIARLLMDAFEEYLNSQSNEGDVPHEYTSDQLYSFFDEHLAELCCLVRQDNDLWIPYPKDWVKENCIFMYARRLCHDIQETEKLCQRTQEMEVD